MEKKLNDLNHDYEKKLLLLEQLKSEYEVVWYESQYLKEAEESVARR